MRTLTLTIGKGRHNQRCFSELSNLALAGGVNNSHKKFSQALTCAAISAPSTTDSINRSNSLFFSLLLWMLTGDATNRTTSSGGATTSNFAYLSIHCDM